MKNLPELKVGDSFANLEPVKARIKNPEGHRNDGGGLFKFNERAWIMDGGKLTIVAIDGDQILARHQKPGKEKSTGAQAGNGALFLMSRWKFLKMTVEDLKIRAEDMEKEYVERLKERARIK
jgi:hypothetical protein